MVKNMENKKCATTTVHKNGIESKDKPKEKIKEKLVKDIPKDPEPIISAKYKVDSEKDDNLSIDEEDNSAGSGGSNQTDNLIIETPTPMPRTSRNNSLADQSSSSDAEAPKPRPRTKTPAYKVPLFTTKVLHFVYDFLHIYFCFIFLLVLWLSLTIFSEFSTKRFVFFLLAETWTETFLEQLWRHNF